MHDYTTTPNRNPALLHQLSRKLLDHLDNQLLDKGKKPIDRSGLPADKQPGRDLLRRMRLLRLVDQTPELPAAPQPKVFGCTVSRALFDQIETFAEANNLATGRVMREAIVAFLDDQTPRNRVRTLTITPHTKFPKRTNSVTFAINPNVNPMLLERLEQFATQQKLTTSAVMRRAVYEHILANGGTGSEAAMLDAWGDAPKR